MVGINPRLGQNYQMQTKKVAAQEDGNNQQQTQQAEVQAVKLPNTPSLQQPIVKVPLANLQFNAGIKVNDPKETKEPVAERMADFNIPNRYMLNEMLEAGVFEPNDTIKLKIGEKNGWIQFLTFTVNAEGRLVSTGSGECISELWE